MSWVIRANSFLCKCSLKVDLSGVYYQKIVCFGSIRQFSYDQIDAVLMADNSELSIQSGQKVLTIQTDPNDPEHQLAIQALTQGVRRSAGLPA
jgi:hypothetical protein